MEKVRIDTKQAEREERKRDNIESQKEQLRLRAERDVARREVEKLTEQHSRYPSISNQWRELRHTVVREKH